LYGLGHLAQLNFKNALLHRWTANAVPVNYNSTGKFFVGRFIQPQSFDGKVAHDVDSLVANSRIALLLNQLTV
jgi:hypothetical protein